MSLRYLLDTHVLVRWVSDIRKLSREQLRILDRLDALGETVAVSALSLMEIAVLARESNERGRREIDSIFDLLRTNPAFQILPLTIEIAIEFAAIRNRLRDPVDTVIVATARIHGLRLLTSDDRIIESGLVPAIE